MAYGEAEEDEDDDEGENELDLLLGDDEYDEQAKERAEAKEALRCVQCNCLLVLPMPANMSPSRPRQAAARPVLAGTAGALRGLPTFRSAEAVCPEGALVGALALGTHSHPPLTL